MDWITQTENRFHSRGGFKVGSIRTDNGGEFTSNALHEFFRARGIEHQLTVPHTSFQNGAVERAHRSIEEKTRCHLVGGRVPPSFWPHAVSCAVYLLNRLPIPSKNKIIPFCLWNNVAPEDFGVEHLRIFGCAAYATLPPALRDGKFAPTAIAGIMVGYDSNHKGYRIFHPPSKKIFVSNKVRFDESIFPLADSKETTLSHDFATSAVGGIPSYPKSGKTLASPRQTYDDDLETQAPSDVSDKHSSPESIDSSGSDANGIPEFNNSSFSLSDGIPESDDSSGFDATGTPESYDSSGFPIAASPEDERHDIEMANTENDRLALENLELHHQLELAHSLLSDNQAVLTKAASDAQDQSATALAERQAISTAAQALATVNHDLHKRLSEQSDIIDYLRRPPIRFSHNMHEVPYIEDSAPQRQASNKRNAQITGVSNSVAIPTAVTTSSDVVHSVVPVDKNGALTQVPVDEAMTTAIRDAITDNPQWSPSGIDASNAPLLLLNNLAEDSRALVIRNSDNELTQQVLVPEVTLPESPKSSKPIERQAQIGMTAVVRGNASIFNFLQTPAHINDALSCDKASVWKAACLRELNAFTSHKTFQLVPLPADKRALGTRWVLTVKGNNMAKARLVAQGHCQIEGIDYTETFAPVVRYDSVRVLLALAACLKLEINQMDVDTAFLNSPMNEPVYVKQPPRFTNPDHPDYVWKLTGAMYGLKQAPLLWNKHIHGTLTEIGFQRHAGDLVESGSVAAGARLGWVVHPPIPKGNLWVFGKSIGNGLSHIFLNRDLGNRAVLSNGIEGANRI